MYFGELAWRSLLSVGGHTDSFFVLYFVFNNQCFSSFSVTAVTESKDIATITISSGMAFCGIQVDVLDDQEVEFSIIDANSIHVFRLLQVVTLWCFKKSIETIRILCKRSEYVTFSTRQPTVAAFSSLVSYTQITSCVTTHYISCYIKFKLCSVRCFVAHLSVLYSEPVIAGLN